MSEHELTPEQKAGLEKIKKILSKINHEGGATQASEEEMDTALKMARKMMDRFNIDEGLFEKLVSGSDADRQSAFDSMMKDTAFSRKTFKGTEFFHYFAYAVEYVCDVGFHYNYAYLKNPQARFGETHSYRYCIDFYGMPRDVAIAKALYQELVATMHAMARFRYGPGWGPKHNGYSFGLAERVHARARDVKRQRDAAPGDAEAAKAGAIVLSKKALLDRYKYDVLGYARPMTDAERAKLEAERAAARALHKQRYENDPEYRKQYDREQKKAANRKGPRQRRVDGEAYNQGYSDGAEVSLGTNGISGRAQGRLD